MRRALVVQQVENEPAGTLPAALAAVSVACETVRPYAGEPLPASLESVDGLVLLGGPWPCTSRRRIPSCATSSG